MPARRFPPALLNRGTSPPACALGHHLFLTFGYGVTYLKFVVAVPLSLSRSGRDMSGEEKIALDLVLVLLIIVLVWARWER
jgi:hypothetical protein